MKQTSRMVARCIAALVCAIVPCTAIAQTEPVFQPEDVTGTVINMGGMRPIPGRTTDWFRLHIDRVSTVEEIAAYAALLKEKGPDAVVSAMQKAEEKGFIQIGSSLGYPVAVIRVLDTDKGRVIRAATDRPIQFFEAWRNLRTVDYGFGVLEIVFDKNGKGEGKMIPAAKIGFNKEGTIEIESYGSEPFRLMGVAAEPSKEKEKK
ncbi:MAG: hypothetical protein AB1714_29880 [Acidobacteriota bacterium]